MWAGRLQATGMTCMAGMAGDGPLVQQLPFLPHDLFGQPHLALNSLNQQQQQQQQQQLPLMPPDLLNMALDLAPPQQQAQQQSQQQQQQQSQQWQTSAREPAAPQRGASLDRDAKQALARKKNREVCTWHTM
jgi:hypothetical protein